jgi:thiamine kinase-like enzyme
LRPLLLTSGQDDASRLIMLPFASHPAQQGQEPVAVIKIASDAKFNNETEVEQTVLQEVRERLDDKTRQSVPEPLGTFHYRGLAVGIESCAPGATLWASSGAWGVSSQRKIDDLELSVKWLTAFHRQTESARLPWDQGAIERWIEMPIAAYAQVRDVTAAEEHLFSAMRSHANTLIGAELPLVWQHNDFAPWNLYRKGDHLTVIDWEFNRDWEHTRAGPALCDLLYFVTYWNNITHHLYSLEAELAGMRTLFVEAAPRRQTTQAARQAIANYMAALKIDWRFLPLLLVYTWTERLVYSYGRAQKLAGEGSKSRTADKFANYIALFAAHAETLFAAQGDGFWQVYANQAEKVGINPAPVEALG